MSPDTSQPQTGVGTGAAPECLILAPSDRIDIEDWAPEGEGWLAAQGHWPDIEFLAAAEKWARDMIGDHADWWPSTWITHYNRPVTGWVIYPPDDATGEDEAIDIVTEGTPGAVPAMWIRTDTL